MSRSCSRLRAASSRRSEYSPWAFLSSAADDFAQVIDADVRGLRAGAGFERRGIAPAHHPRQNADFEKRDELLLRVDLAASGGRGLHPPCRAQHAIAIEREQAGEEAGPRCFGRRLEGEHLHMAVADLEVIAVPRDRTLDDLPVHASIAAELVALCPLFKVEQVAEELKGLRPCRAVAIQANCRDGD